MWRVLALTAVAIALCCCPLGCSRKPLQTVSALSTDIQRLAKLCNVPDFVESAEWQVIQHGDGRLGPSDFTLIARMRVSEEGATVLDQSMTRTEDSTVPIDYETLPDWLDKDKALLTLDKGSSGCCKALVGVYDADMFHRGSYLNGILLRPERNTLIIVLHTM